MMGNSITIRRETPYDFLQVDKIIRTAFLDMEDSDHSEHLLVERLRSSDTFVPELSLVAVLPEFQGKGIGGMLVREGHRRAAELTDGGLDGIHGDGAISRCLYFSR